MQTTTETRILRGDRRVPLLLRVLALFSLSSCLLVAACGGGGEEAASSQQQGTTRTDQQGGTQQPAPQSRQRIDPCALVTKADVQPVLGEPAGDPQTTDQVVGSGDRSLLMVQCYYPVAAQTSVQAALKNVSIQVVQKDPAKATRAEPKQFWETARSGASQSGQRVDDVSGLGDGAYWVTGAGSRQGVLWVVKNDVVIVIYVQGDPPSLDAARGLTQKALSRV